MDIEEEVFEGLSPKEIAESALVGIVVTIVVIGTVKLIKRISRRRSDINAPLWNTPIHP